MERKTEDWGVPSNVHHTWSTGRSLDDGKRKLTLEFTEHTYMTCWDDPYPDFYRSWPDGGSCSRLLAILVGNGRIDFLLCLLL